MLSPGAEANRIVFHIVSPTRPGEAATTIQQRGKSLLEKIISARIRMMAKKADEQHIG